ncbi:cell division protein ZapA [Lacticaseibacillus paracasei]|uniref:cell division protein ZapA n=1 Tax=Lacticaseibacillus paracasei TaxID=1597 RepID=UPI0006EF5CD6|nr:cell division protein ZapA [Lacticaseibacillus paracasei]KRN08262.1 Stimulator of FtsZ polymerization and component of cell-division Z-ring [Lacticaseibacillus paracasei subsp. tolerans DSM 20258]MCT3363193.1 cell division protein ZapA [Lacticaseibacillus paracasei]MDP0528409.1 cell division protein ZapA [Lacticaseibacillus paracasei]GEL37413.1 cell division protein ZapA [Lacticaseibacillus paracasei subsp. tolerans]
MSEEKRRFKAVIGDKTYTIIGPGSEQHFITVTKLLNERLAQVKTLAPDLSAEEQAILVAFNSVSDQVKLLAVQQDDHEQEE